MILSGMLIILNLTSEKKDLPDSKNPADPHLLFNLFHDLELSAQFGDPHLLLDIHEKGL